MRRTRFRLLWLLALGAALLAGCGKKHEAPTDTAGSPEDAALALLPPLHEGRFADFWKQALPPADYQHLRQDWTRLDPEDSPVTDEDRAKFADAMHQLTEPDAEKKLFAGIRPRLLQYDKEYRDQMPLMAGIFQSMALTAIDQTKELTHVEKQQVRDILAVVATWVQQVPWGDQDKARQAIAALTDTARSLQPGTLDQLRALDFDASLAKYGIAWGGLKRLLAVYGLSLDQSFNSATVETLEASDSSAHLRIHYVLLGTRLATEVTMIKLDGHWYDNDLISRVRAAHGRLLPPPAPVPASSAAQPTGSPVATAGSTAR